MRSALVTVIVVGVGLTGCGSVLTQAKPSATTTTTRPATPTTTDAATTVVTPATVQGSITTTTTTTRPGPTTTRPAPTTLRLTTTTTRLLTRAEATAGLCTAVADADQRIQQGRLLSGGLRLSGALATYEKAADPAVVAAARAMLRSGVNASPEGYVTARSTASTACAQAGFPIQLSGPVQCLVAPCP